MSQALKATFSGFQKEQRRLGIPKSEFPPRSGCCEPALSWASGLACRSLEKGFSSYFSLCVSCRARVAETWFP